MELSEGYKNAESTIKALEQQSALCEKALRECGEYAKVAEKDIEEHFNKCLNALAARKDVLLRELEQVIREKERKIEYARTQLESSIQAVKQTQKGVSMVYGVDKGSAEALWKGINSINVLKVESLQITIKLPATLFDSIQTHGEVEGHAGPLATIPGRFNNADMVTTIASSMTTNTDGKPARFYGICHNPNDDCLYISDCNNNSIIKVTMKGTLIPFVRESKRLNGPRGIVFHNKENTFYVANYHAHTINKITAAGTVSVFAGSGRQGFADGPWLNANFNTPRSVTIDQQTGNVFVCDTGNHMIRRISPEGNVSTLAGSLRGFADASGRAAKFNYPYGVCFDTANQSLIVCDTKNNKLRRVTLNGEVSTVCEIPDPNSVSITANHTLIVSSSAHKLFKVTRQGQSYNVVHLAGSGNKERVDGFPHECGFFYPKGMAVHESSNSLFVIDHGSNTIRKVSFGN